MNDNLDPCRVIVQFKDGASETFTANRMPWEWRSFLVIAKANAGDRLTYVPMSNVDSFEIEQLASRHPRLAFSE